MHGGKHCGHPAALMSHKGSIDLRPDLQQWACRKHPLTWGSEHPRGFASNWWLRDSQIVEGSHQARQTLVNAG
jgi:hypothetical protein